MKPSVLMRAAALVGLLLSNATCSLLISGEDTPLRCAEEGVVGPPACDEGFACHRGVCVREGEGGASAGQGVSGAPHAAGAASLGGQGGVAGAAEAGAAGVVAD